MLRCCARQDDHRSSVFQKGLLMSPVQQALARSDRDFRAFEIAK
jgi:hypothetical protein